MSRKKKQHQNQIKQEAAQAKKSSKAASSAATAPKAQSSHYDFSVPRSCVLSSGTSSKFSSHSIRYFVYSVGSTVNICSDFTVQGDTYMGCSAYCRTLGSVGDFRGMRREDVEHKAYDAWMDGAR